MGRGKSEGQDYLGRLQWVATPIGEHRWTGGPIFCRARGAGWVVELSRHDERGRLSVPLVGPFESLGEAKRAASALLLRAQARKLRRVCVATPVEERPEELERVPVESEERPTWFRPPAHPIVKVCDNPACGGEFQTCRVHQRFCSVSCRRASFMPTRKICDVDVRCAVHGRTSEPALLTKEG